jgi:hypothetical protein
MRITRRWLGRTAAALGLAVPAVSGCQTYYGGMTLPSGQYLKHSPQYFPPDPTFPLQRERDSMLDPDGGIRRGVAAPLPQVAPTPAGPGLAPLNPGQVGAPAPVQAPPPASDK